LVKKSLIHISDVVNIHCFVQLLIQTWVLFIVKPIVNLVIGEDRELIILIVFLLQIDTF